MSQETTSNDFLFEITHGKNIHVISLTGDKTLHQFKEEINNTTKVPISLQKILFKSKPKPNLKDDQQLIKNLGLKPDPYVNKILLIGSTLETVIASSNPKAVTSATTSSSSSKDKELIEPQSPSGIKLSQLPEHKKVIDKGLPTNAEKVEKQKDLPLPNSINGVRNKRGDEIRLTFKSDLQELWVQSKEKTEKIPYITIRDIESESIVGNEDYHLMSLQVGNSPQNKLWFYFVPSQYVRAIKYTLLGVDFPLYKY
ncbi:hypothetical protein ABK040_016617 [Willaertia magna]